MQQQGHVLGRIQTSNPYRRWWWVSKELLCCVFVHYYCVKELALILHIFRGFCDKTPLVVQDYLGYKSTTDPLFKADALMLKAVPLVDDSVMDEADYVDLVEQYRDKADQTSLLAYTSSWGEANPNGSKVRKASYFEMKLDICE